MLGIAGSCALKMLAAFVSLAGWLVGVCSGWLVCAVVGWLAGWLVVSCAVAVYAGAGSGLVGEARNQQTNQHQKKARLCSKARANKQASAHARLARTPLMHRRILL